MIDFSQELLSGHYKKAYKQPDFKHDSPELSRILLNRLIVNKLDTGTEPKILNIGSGPQSLERQFVTAYKNKPWFSELSIVTSDIAEILKHKFLVKNRDNILHVRSDALHLPFVNNSFSLVVSNLAIDFLPHSAFAEAARVLKPEGYVIFNFHHPNLYKNKPSNLIVQEFWKYLEEQKVLFESKEQIELELLSKGLKTQTTELRSDGTDKWWEVIAQKISLELP